MDTLTKAVQMLNLLCCSNCNGRGFVMIFHPRYLAQPGLQLSHPEKCPTCNGSGLPRLLRPARGSQQPGV